MPLTNKYAKGGYTARLWVAEQRHPVNLILDSGSSALVMNESTYQPQKDGHHHAISLAQNVQYGKGEWYGPVIKMRIRLGLQDEQLQLSHVAETSSSPSQGNSFLNADGILGLVYIEVLPESVMNHAIAQIAWNESFVPLLTLTPDTYWQIHAPQCNQASFKRCSLPGWPNQLILGLALLNNYYTIFDRLMAETGAIHFATKVDFPDPVRCHIQGIFSFSPQHSDNKISNE